MTDKTHLDTLVTDDTGKLGKALVLEFTRLVRDPELASASYATKLRALMDEHLEATDDAPP